MSTVYLVRLEAVQIIVLDADSDEEAVHMAVQNPNGDWQILGVELEGKDLTPSQVEQEIRHGAFDLRSDKAVR